MFISLIATVTGFAALTAFTLYRAGRFFDSDNILIYQVISGVVCVSGAAALKPWLYGYDATILLYVAEWFQLAFVAWAWAWAVWWARLFQKRESEV